MPFEGGLMERTAASGVTLCAVTSVAREATVAALRHSQGQIQFDRALLLSDVCPSGLTGTGIEWRQIEPLGSRSEYSRFMLHQLAGHIETPHVLIVQWDGFVRDGRRWQDAFLEYDYIGAAWPQFSDGAVVGNGGFSLRSKRLLDATRALPAGSEPEDLAICRTHRHMLEVMYDLRFAGLEIARQFSYEREVSTGSAFGFHGCYNLFAELPDKMRAHVICSLEPGVVGARESVELMFEALVRRDFALARLMMKHVLAHPQVARRILLGIKRAMVGQQRGGRALPAEDLTNER